MDLSKHTLPPEDEAALSAAADFVGKKDHKIEMVGVASYPGHEGYLKDFATALRLHQELIEALESYGYAVIDGTREVMECMLKQAENLALNAIFPEGERKALLIYKGEWVQSASSLTKTVIIDYHIVVGVVRTGTEDLVNMSSVGSAKFPLTQGVTMHDELFKAFVVRELDIDETDNDEDDEGH